MVISINLTESEKMQLEYLHTVNARDSKSAIIGKLISNEYRCLVNSTLQGNFGGGTLKKGRAQKGR